MLRIRQLKGHDPQFGLQYALMSDEPFGLVAKVACGDQELYGKEADRAALAWARKLAAVPDLIAALQGLLDGIRVPVDEADHHAEREEASKAAREALRNAGVA